MPYEENKDGFAVYMTAKMRELILLDEKKHNAREPYVIEKCSELIKELIKEQRGQNRTFEIAEEACNVLLTVMTMLYQRGFRTEQIMSIIEAKCLRAIDAES